VYRIAGKELSSPMTWFELRCIWKALFDPQKALNTCLPFGCIAAAQAIAKGTCIRIGAQDCAQATARSPAMRMSSQASSTTDDHGGNALHLTHAILTMHLMPLLDTWVCEVPPQTKSWELPKTITGFSVDGSSVFAQLSAFRILENVPGW
jgi:hypothetical protein